MGAPRPAAETRQIVQNVPVAIAGLTATLATFILPPNTWWELESFRGRQSNNGGGETGRWVLRLDANAPDANRIFYEFVPQVADYATFGEGSKGDTLAKIGPYEESRTLTLLVIDATVNGSLVTGTAILRQAHGEPFMLPDIQADLSTTTT